MSVTTAKLGAIMVFAAAAMLADLSHGSAASAAPVVATAIHTPSVTAQNVKFGTVNVDLLYDYRTNVALYPVWQKFLRDRQPETLIFWSQNDPFFTPARGEAFHKDLPSAELHRLAAGHFAVEDNLYFIAAIMTRFYDSQVTQKS